MPIDLPRLRAAYLTARSALLAERTPAGFWEGELSASALSTATACAALALVDRATHASLIANGLQWLADHQNTDGGWGDTVQSVSNISTTMLCRAAFHIGNQTTQYAAALQRCESGFLSHYGKTPAELAEAVRQRYGKDRTFSVPILTMCALAGLVPWREVPRLPFEMACLPQSWYRFVGLPVVSYALPALIAIGQCIHHHRGTWNLLTGFLRWLGRGLSSRVLERIQPSSGGFLEATPLTSFVVMSLASCRSRLSSKPQANDRVIAQGIQFIVASVRPDGSWPIDTNLSIWVTTLAINALAVGDDLAALDHPEELVSWLLAQQTQVQHPFTGAAPGAWGWSHRPGSVPDCDDTPGAMLALQNLSADPAVVEACRRGGQWIIDLQNRDGGWPTFCRGWGKLPFDRSGADLTAHALRALKHQDCPARVREKGLAYLTRQQRPDGSWLPLWFGNQHAPDDINPVYGTARVLAMYRDLGITDRPEAQRGLAFLAMAQNSDGGWGGAIATPSSIEETSLVVELLAARGLADAALERAVEYLICRVEADTFHHPAPIGFYFAKLWYFEKLYPLIFTVAALGRVWRGTG